MSPQQNIEAWRLTATEALKLLRSGEMNVEHYARSLLSRIEQREPVVKAWAFLDPSLILEQAKKLDEVPPEERGPLHGIPIGVKDIILTKDMPTQYNSRLHESQTPTGMDATNIIVLRNAGALIFGKTTTTEFASCHQGGVHQNHTTNAHDPKRTPGGSSSGSAAAVADYHVPIALGTQTAGSMIRPGSFNGIYAFKPTWGAISREGLAQYSITCDTLGFFTRSAEDFEMVSNLFQLEDDEVKSVNIQDAKVAFLRTHVWPKGSESLRVAWQKAKDLLVQKGVSVEEIELPADFNGISDWHEVVLDGEGRTSFLGPYMLDRNLLHETMRGHVENAGGFSRRQLLDAYDNCARLRPLWDKIATQFDAVITPGVTDEAPLGLEHTGDKVSLLDTDGDPI